jgi:hypothetical protein
MASLRGVVGDCASELLGLVAAALAQSASAVRYLVGATGVLSVAETGWPPGSIHQPWDLCREILGWAVRRKAGSL